MAQFTPNTFTKAVELALEGEIKKIGEEEIAEALARTEERMRGALATIVLKLSRNYEAQFDQDRIVITVKNETDLH